MGANSSPPASDVTLDAVKSKKRKTSDAPLPIGLSASNATSPSSDDPADIHTEATLERMATALDLGHSFLDRALLDPTLPKSTSLTMEDSRMRLQQLTAFVDALRAADVDGLALHLQRMFVADAGLLSTLREAADRALTNSRRPSPSSSAAASPTPPSTATTSNQHEHDGDVDMDGHNEDPRASIHEEEAAQALTGLRTSSSSTSSSSSAPAGAPSSSSSSASTRPHAASTTTSAAINNNTINVGHSAPPTAPPPHTHLHHPPLHLNHPQHQQQLPTLSISLPMASPRTAIPYAHLAHHNGLPAMSPSTASALYAAQPYAGGPLFVSAPSPTTHVPAPSPTAHTPGALPSIFARGLLAPIASPYDAVSANANATSCTPMMSHLAPFVDWNSLAPPPPAASSSSQTPLPSSSSDTPVDALTPAYRGSPPLLAGHTAQASPVKRKSILSVAKQLVGSPTNSSSAAAPAASPTSPNSSSSAAAAALTLPIAKSLAALERAHPTRKANPRRWTKDEDDALRTAVENHKEKNWKAIAAQVPGRNHTQCLQRWTKVLAPGLVKGHWSPHEDELLRRLVAGGNKNWGEVAAKIPGRTSKQCRERWHNHLDPNIVRGAYTPEEDRIILEAQARLGNRWSVIAAMLPGRTEDAVKIRWKSHCRLWKARKYLRKTNNANSSANANELPSGDGDDDHDPDVEEDDDDDDPDDDEPDDDDNQDEEHRLAAVHAIASSASVPSATAAPDAATTASA